MLEFKNILTKIIPIPQQQRRTNDCSLYVICAIETLIQSDERFDDSIDFSNWFEIQAIKECRHRLKMFALKKVFQQYW